MPSAFRTCKALSRVSVGVKPLPLDSQAWHVAQPQHQGHQSRRVPPHHHVRPRPPAVPACINHGGKEAIRARARTARGKASTLVAQAQRRTGERLRPQLPWKSRALGAFLPAPTPRVLGGSEPHGTRPGWWACEAHLHLKSVSSCWCVALISRLKFPKYTLT